MDKDLQYERMRMFFFWVGIGISIGLIIIMITGLLVGCQRGDVEVSPVIQGQPAPHRGWNFGPDSWVRTGDQVKVGGVVVWVKGLDPNDLFRE